MKIVQFYLLAALALLASCSIIKEDHQRSIVPVNVHVNNFSISQADVPGTKASPAADYDGVKAISLAFYTSDLRTAKAEYVRMTFSADGKSFNPTTGLATVNTGFANTVQGSGATESPL